VFSFVVFKEKMEDILSIQTPVEFDESISHYEVHAHQPYTASNYNNCDEIRISIQHQDQCILLSRSGVRLCGRIIDTDTKTGPKKTWIVNNGFCFLFEDARIEMNGIEIDRCKNVGLSSLMKNWLSINPNQNVLAENSGWYGLSVKNSAFNEQGYFDVFIPLGMILPIAEDYRKVLVNVKLELILTRSRNDSNAILQEGSEANDTIVYEKVAIELSKIEWLMPYVLLSDSRRINLLKFLEKDRPITITYRARELFEYPVLPVANKHVWSVKTSNQLEKPRFVVIGLQTNRKSVNIANASEFDNCNLRNVKLFLNSQYYPYHDLNLNIKQNQYSIAYDMFANFQSVFYGKEAEPALTRSQFIEKIPLFLIDYSKQNESLKNAPVDVRIEIESIDNFDRNTAAHCLIIHDRIIQYTSGSGDVKK